MTESLGMYGAVDLSSLSAPPAGGGEAASKVRGGVVVDVTAQSMASALDVSAKLPVVLVFYSARSEASVALDSRLQEIAVRRGGRFQLGRVDVDAAVEVAQAFRVTGVPAAVDLIQGQPVPLFQGAPADGEIDKVIDQVLATAAQYGMTGVLDGQDGADEPEPEISEHHRAALDAMEANDFHRAADEFRAALREEPGNAELAYGLAQAELMSRVTGTDPNAILVRASSLPFTDVETQLAAADVEVAYGRAQSAFARLIEVVKATSGQEREDARKRLVELFEVVGSAEPLVAEARRALANALF